MEILVFLLFWQHAAFTRFKEQAVIFMIRIIIGDMASEITGKRKLDKSAWRRL